MVDKKLTVISTFAGCGGSSLGYKMAGFKELLAIDFDKHAVETFKLNFPEVPAWEKDISTIKGKDIFSFCKIKKGDLDIFDGSPPCQGFSTTGKRKINDSRNQLFNEYVRLIKELDPKVFVMENVSGMFKGKMRGMFIEIMECLKSLNYNVKCKLLNSKFYDVPQARERVFFIGIRKDLNIIPTYPQPNKYIITVRQAFKDVPESEIIKPTGKILENYESIKVGGTLADHFKKTDQGSSYFNVSRLDFNKPSKTILKMFSSGMSGLLHPKEKRFVTISELKRLASFPDDFIFPGKFKEQWARIGNAVMPMQMFHIAKHLKESVFELKN